ncbi:MAG: glycosyltransferase [Opitutaceae bacterium]|nr:glycosyltransferase [Opitutaceae bacterium]
MSPRPRLLYFNGPFDYLGERLIISYIEPFRRLLDQDFEVVSVEGDRDFAVEVKRHAPDLVLFHGGVESPKEREVTIRNTDKFPEIPRLGWMFRDPFSPSRRNSMNRFREWGVNQVVADFRASDCPIPFFKDSLYLPWWIEDEVFRDYGEKKTLPITLTGSGWLQRQFYDWRLPIFLKLAEKLPLYHVPAFETHIKNDAYVGEPYARLLNRSHFSAGCGTVSRFLTLKLLEIPAARCCLITEETEVLKAMGFADGVNCVFATPDNVVPKVQALMEDAARLQTITDAGHAIVHGAHTRKHRRLFAEWLQLWKAKRPGERIVQPHPFEPLRLAAADAPGELRFPTENPLTEALVEGYRLLDAGQPGEARPKFEWVINIIPHVAEARVGLALCLLRAGDLALACRQLEHVLYVQRELCNYRCPDPVSISLHAVLSARLGELGPAANLLAATATMKHPAVNAMRWLFGQTWPELRRKHAAFRDARGDESQNSETTHLLPLRSFDEWLGLWSPLVKA